MPAGDINGNRNKGQCDLPGLQMCLGFISGAPMRPTGLKHPKTTCFRGIVRINTQGSGSSQMVIRCDRNQATGLTLFKGQGASVRECVCMSQCMTASVMWRQSESQLFFLFFIRQKLSTGCRVGMIDFCPIVPSAFQVGGGDQTISHQWIHHHLRIQSSWPFLSLPIWWPAKDWWRERARVRTDSPLPCHHDGENLSTVTRTVSVGTAPHPSPFPLMKDGMENEKRGLILKYQFPGWSRIIYELSVSFVIPQRFDLR